MMNMSHGLDVIWDVQGQNLVRTIGIIIIEHAYGDLINPDHLIRVDKDSEGNSMILVD
jgi:hypothetical protein